MDECVPRRCEIFYGPIAESADGQLAVVPDFIANCTARVSAHLMSESDVDLIDEAIFRIPRRPSSTRFRRHTAGIKAEQAGCYSFEIALSKPMRRTEINDPLNPRRPPVL